MNKFIAPLVILVIGIVSCSSNTNSGIPSSVTFYASVNSLPNQISVEHPEYSIYATGMYNGEQFHFGTDTQPFRVVSILQKD